MEDGASWCEGPEVGSYKEVMVGGGTFRGVVAARLHGESGSVGSRGDPVGLRHQVLGFKVLHEFGHLVIGGYVPSVRAGALQGVGVTEGVVTGGGIVGVKQAVDGGVGAGVLPDIRDVGVVGVLFGSEVGFEPAVVEEADHIVGVAAAVLRMEVLAGGFVDDDVVGEGGRGVGDGGDPHHRCGRARGVGGGVGCGYCRCQRSAGIIEVGGLNFRDGRH